MSLGPRRVQGLQELLIRAEENGLRAPESDSNASSPGLVTQVSNSPFSPLLEGLAGKAQAPWPAGSHSGVLERRLFLNVPEELDYSEAALGRSGPLGPQAPPLPAGAGASDLAF